MIHITDAAQEHIAKLLPNQEPGTQIRVSVTNPGTVNAECVISYCFPDSVSTTDIEIKFHSISVYVNELSMPYLNDTEIDFVTNKFSSQLIIKAPNAKIEKKKKNVSLHNISLIKRVRYLLESQINRQLASHGGYVTLQEITDDMWVILQLSGGCNGCSMVDYTLKEYIEKELLEKFPELKGIRDFTKHKFGKHSYY